MPVVMKEGAYYKRRDGEIVGPATGGGKKPWPWWVGGISYTKFGFILNPDEPRPFDLIEEVPNPNQEEKTMLLTETKTITKTEIKEVIGGKLPNGASISVEPFGGHRVYLVVGAPWDSRSAGCFGKDSLSNLIEELTAVRDAMED